MIQGDILKGPMNQIENVQVIHKNTRKIKEKERERLATEKKKEKKKKVWCGGNEPFPHLQGRLRNEYLEFQARLS